MVRRIGIARSNGPLGGQMTDRYKIKGPKEKRAITRKRGSGAHRQSDTRAKKHKYNGYSCKGTQGKGQGCTREKGTIANLHNGTG